MSAPTFVMHVPKNVGNIHEWNIVEYAQKHAENVLKHATPVLQHELERYVILRGHIALLFFL
jgi:hypothetical protein